MAEGHHRITQRLLEYIQVEALLRTDLNVAEETGVCVRVVREIRTRFVERLRREVQFETPRVLGLDGVRADASKRIIFTDIEKGLVLDLITSGCKNSIRERLEAFPQAHQIQIVLIDMCRTLRQAVLEELPLAVIIIDRFHIMRSANQVMDKVRNRLYPKRKKDREPGQTERPRPEPFRQRRGPAGEAGREHRERWFLRRPELELAYDLKEAFLEIFDHETYSAEPMSKAAARRRYEQWVQRLSADKKHEELRKEFDKIITTMANWGEYVFNYFDFPFTNAFTESMNRKVKDVKRDTRGCSFNTVQGRAVFGHFIRKQMIEAREQEAAIIRKPSKRRRQIDSTKSGAGCKAGEGSAPLYRTLEYVQTVLEFTN
jgi:transposase